MYAVRTPGWRQGFTPLHKRLSSIDEPIHQGIDGVFEKVGQYFIVEAKYKGNATLSTLSDGTKQMSDKWIIGENRLFHAVGENENLFKTINQKGYKRLLAEVASDGTIIYKELDSSANIIGIFTH